MNHRLVIVALAAVGFGAASSWAQSAPADAPASTNQSNQAPKDREPCGGHLDNPGKADRFLHRSLSIGTLVGRLFTAVPEFAKPPAGYPTQWRKGPAAFGRLYGDALAMQTAQETTRFLAGLGLHEDLRYYPAASRNPLRRTLHAITFAAFDRSDSGRTTLAATGRSGHVSVAMEGLSAQFRLLSTFPNLLHAALRVLVEDAYMITYLGRAVEQVFGMHDTVVRRLALDQMASCLADDDPIIDAALRLGLQHLGTSPESLGRNGLCGC